MPKTLFFTGLSIVALIPVLLIIGIYTNASLDARGHYQEKVFETSLHLVLIGVLGMLGKKLVDEYTAARVAEEQKILRENRDEEQRMRRESSENEARTAARLTALNMLTDSYWKIKKSLHIIKAHRSARSYGEQIRAIIDYRLTLQKLHNEIKAEMYSLSDVDRISDALHELDLNLCRLTEEWTEGYLELSQMQIEDEKRGPKEKRVPERIDGLKILSDVSRDDFSALHKPFERVAELMRKDIFAGQPVV